MLYTTDISTASKILNFNNPIQGTDRFRSVGLGITLLLSVLKGHGIETVWQKSVIYYIRAKNKWHKTATDDNNNNNRDMYISPLGGMN